MQTDKQQTRPEKLAHRLSGTAAAIAMTVSLVAGLGSAEVVAVTALALAAGRRSRGFGLPGTLERARRRSPAAPRMPQPR